MNDLTRTVDIVRLDNGRRDAASDHLAVEEPLEIRIGREGSQLDAVTVSITMRTPGNDSDLVLGFLLTEGIVRRSDDVVSLSHAGRPLPGRDTTNTIQAQLSAECDFDPERLRRNFYTTSSCGVCGKTSIEAIRSQTQFRSEIVGSTLQLTAEQLMGIPAGLRAQQRAFDKTGGLHAAGLFDANGRVTLIREDVGRHNAFDKLVGATIDQLPLSEHGIVLSGRASFELLQKAAAAGCALVAAVGAPSSLAVECAVDLEITLIGFLRDNRFNIYSGSRRILESRR